MTVTVDASANNEVYSVVIFDVTGHDAATPFPQSSVHNGATFNPATNSGTGTLTLGSNPLSSHMVIGMFGAGADGGGGLATPAGYTALINQNTSYTQSAVFYRTGTTSPAITCDDLGQAVGNWAGIAFAIAAASDAAVVPAATATLSLVGQTAVIVPGGMAITADLALIGLDGQTAVIVPGGMAITADLALIGLDGQTAVIVPGGMAITADLALIGLDGQTAIVAPGGVNIETAAGTLTITGESVLVLSGGSLIQATPGLLNLAGQTAVVLPGSISLGLAVAELALAGQTAVVLPGTVSIQAAAGELAISGQTAALLPGAVAVAVAAGVLSVTGLSLESIGEAAFVALGRPFAAEEIARFFAQGVMTFDNKGIVSFTVI